MTVNYRLIQQATPGVKGGGQYKYYARACDRQKASIDDLADLMVRRSSLSHGDILSTLYELAHIIPELLLENRTVELGELGTFSLNLKSVGADQPRVDGYRLIKGAEISFRPSPRLKQAVRTVEYTKSKTSEW